MLNMLLKGRLLIKKLKLYFIWFYTKKNIEE